MFGQHTVDAVLVRRMRIGRRLEPLRFRPRILAPDLGVAEEEALFRREAVDRLGRGCARTGEIRHQRQPHAAVVADVLSERQLPVDVRVAGDDVAGILIRDAGGALVERLAVGRRPPVAQVALAVELAPLVVEPVRQLVTDHRSSGAIIHRRVAFTAVERRLQDAGREVDVVARAAVVRVHGRRRHRPFAAVERLADLLQVAMPIRGDRLFEITERVGFRHPHGLVVAPFVRISNPIGHGGEFRIRGRLRRCRSSSSPRRCRASSLP